MELTFQFCFERLRIHSRSHSSEHVQEIALRSLQPRCRSIDKQFFGQWQPEVGHAPPGQFRTVEPRRSYADHSEWMSVNLIGRADYGRIGAILLFPDVVTHDCYRRSSFLIVCIGHQPAKPRLHTERLEEVSGDVLAVAGIRLRL